MTKRDALIAAVALPDLTDNEIELAMIDNDVADGLYTKGDGKSIAIAAISILVTRLNVSSQSEGSFNISFNAQGLRDRIVGLATKFSLDDVLSQYSGQPKIKAMIKW